MSRKFSVGDDNAHPVRPDKIQNRDYFAPGGVMAGPMKGIKNVADKFAKAAFKVAARKT